MIARQRDIDKLKRRLTEAVPRLAGQEEPEPYPLFVETNWVQITSTSQTDGRYPGSLYRRNGADATFTLVGESGGCWVDTPNAESLTTGVYYPARASGVKTDGKVIFDVIGTFSSSGSYCLASRASSNQTIPNWAGASTAVELDTSVSESGNAELFTGGSFTGVIRLTSALDRKFRVSGGVSFSTNATGVRYCRPFIYNDTPTHVNNAAGSGAAIPTSTGGHATAITFTGDFVAPTDTTYVVLHAGQSSGGNLDIIATTIRLCVEEVS